MRSLSRNLIASLLAIVGLSVLQAGTSFALHDFTVKDVTADESAGNAKIVITPSCPVDYLEYRTEDGTAKAGADYTSVSGTLTSPPFEVEVPILDDSLFEGNETVRVIVSQFTFPGAPVCLGAQIAEAQLTIRDDETPIPTADGGERSAPAKRSKAAVPPGKLGASRATPGGSPVVASPLTNSPSTDGPSLDVAPAPARTSTEVGSHRRFPAALTLAALAVVSFALWLIWRRRFAR